MRVKETANTDIFTWNRQVYQRLKLALSLNLRRQIFFAVCDDLQLRNHVATRLNSALAYPSGNFPHHSPHTGEVGSMAYPRLVTLRLNLNDPNPLVQINQWLANYPPPVVGASSDHPGRCLPIPSFQFVGIELLTKQPVAVQRLFLHYLRLSEHYFSAEKSAPFLESTLLLWLPRPWLHAIQQSSAKFWHCRTGIFVFAGEPKPNLKTQDYTEQSASSPNLDTGDLAQLRSEEIARVKEFDPAVIPYIPVPKSESSDTKSDTKIDHHPDSQPQPASVIASQDISAGANFLSSDQVNQELSNLITTTAKSNNHQDTGDYWQAQQLLSDIARLQQAKAPKEQLAPIYQTLGNLYRAWIERGQTNLENIMIAIIAYQEAITLDHDLPDLADILHDLGTLYWLLHRTPGSPESENVYIEQGIEFYQLVISLIAPDTHTETYASTQNNLGTAYGDLARFSQPVENWQKAIAAYEVALQYWTAQTEPLKHAACQNNLGTAYWHLGQHIKPVENLYQAIAAYQRAVKYYQPDTEPLKYGMMQNNIGTAYWNLAQYEKHRENLELATNFYQEALKYRTATIIPNAYAATKNNLGTAYWHIANLSLITREDKEKFTYLCIAAFEDAIHIANSYQEIELNFDLLGTYSNLGLAHYQLVKDGYLKHDKKSILEHLEAALKNHLQALKKLQNQPEAYQMSFNQVIAVIRTFHDELGIQGQNLALSHVPSHLIPEILSKL